MAASRASLTGDLRRLGVSDSTLVMVHAGLRAIGPVVGGVNTVMQALLGAVGPAGTVMAYADFEPWFDLELETDDVPVFDKRLAHAARDHGVLCERIRTWPGALRSDHPDAGVAAVGRLADWLTRDHPFQYGYGLATPFHRAVDAGVQVLMLGAPYEAITLLHHAEHLADLPGKRVVRYRRRLPGANGPHWVTVEEFDTTQPVAAHLPDDVFTRMANDYLRVGRGHRGTFGQAPATRFDGADLVRFAVDWLERFGEADRP